jgi:hypothetical protein
MIEAVLRFSVVIQGPNWEDVQDLELARAPQEGDTIETRYGTCVVTEVDTTTHPGGRAGKIVCRLP